MILASLSDWLGRRRAMRELRAMDAREAAALTLSDRSPLNRAKTALSVDDAAEALHCWTEARERLGDTVLTSRDSLPILLRLKRYDEAEALMQEGCKRFPRDPYYLEGLAEIAERRPDLPEAIARWTRVQRLFPGSWRGYTFRGACLVRSGRADEAEVLLSKAVSLFTSSGEMLHRTCEMRRGPQGVGAGAATMGAGRSGVPPSSGPGGNFERTVRAR